MFRNISKPHDVCIVDASRDYFRSGKKVGQSLPFIGEESPGTTGQDTLRQARDSGQPGYGKCHRDQTALRAEQSACGV